MIPASWYFEWQETSGKKIKHRIRPNGSSPIYMAAIFRQEHDQPLPVFSIITRDADTSVRYIHDRMPVILPKDAQAAWLDLLNAPDPVLAAALTTMTAVPDEPVQIGLF